MPTFVCVQFILKGSKLNYYGMEHVLTIVVYCFKFVSLTLSRVGGSKRVELEKREKER